jgi:hypothetical protein
VKKLLFAIIAVCAFAGNALSDETLKYQSIYHVTLLQGKEIGDAAGHGVGIAQGLGLAMLSDGSVATTEFIGLPEFIKGTGPVKVYGSLTFSDGSVLWVRNDAESVMKGDRAEIRGSLTITGGNGRFTGATGSGSLTGYRIAAPGNNGSEVFNDVVLNVKK